eukprot:TRINITY_DN55885_c0_g1_i1.p1 TRINITY_DN55885_c0_g1~~TRINITY_DN55885_c0_g1_i1.p1  ORF type:complete len:255 (+),score=51.96 TRINITY_DN55885_c0_g1_i1:96-860(+)
MSWEQPSAPACEEGTSDGQAIPTWFWVVHGVGVLLATAPAATLLMPLPQALEWLAPNSALATSCRGDEGAGVAAGQPWEAPLLWFWMTGPAAEMAFPGTLSPQLCCAAISGIIGCCLFDLLLMLGLSALLMFPATLSPSSESSGGVLRGVLFGWFCFGASGALTHGLVRAGDGAWLPGCWPRVLGTLLGALAVGSLLLNPQQAPSALPAAGASSQRGRSGAGSVQRRGGYQLVPEAPESSPFVNEDMYENAPAE